MLQSSLLFKLKSSYVWNSNMFRQSIILSFLHIKLKCIYSKIKQIVLIGFRIRIPMELQMTSSSSDSIWHRRSLQSSFRLAEKSHLKKKREDIFKYHKYLHIWMTSSEIRFPFAEFIELLYTYTLFQFLLFIVKEWKFAREKSTVHHLPMYKEQYFSLKNHLETGKAILYKKFDCSFINSTYWEYFWNI